MKVKDRILIASRLTAQQCMKLFWVFPVKRNKVLFESYEGKAYSCNPKYLSEYLETHHAGEYELVWSFVQPELFQHLAADHHFRAVRRRSLRWYYEYLTAGVRISNASSELSYYPKRKRQLVINTWHAGGAYKRTGIVSEYVEENNDFQKWRRRAQAGHFDLFLSSSPVFTETNIRAAYGYFGKVLNCGLPRNDLFFDADRVRTCSEKVRRELGISGFVVLFAPTYRGNTKNTFELPPFPLEAIVSGIKKRFGCSPTVLMRAHYFMKYHEQNLTADGNADGVRVIDVTQYPDMQELLCAADLLVTDYSSSIWDYALLGRPCVLYTPDLEYYESSDRGFFTPINEWPGIICRDADALYNTLCNLDEDACKEKAMRHLEQFQSFERGCACEMTAETIQHFVRTGELK